MLVPFCWKFYVLTNIENSNHKNGSFSGHILKSHVKWEHSKQKQQPENPFELLFFVLY